MINVAQLVLLLIVIESLAKGLYAFPGKDPGISTCPSSGLPANSVRLENSWSGKQPLFQLEVKRTESGYLPKENYKVYVQSLDVSKKFDDVLLSLHHGDGQMCPLGTFDTASARFFQPSNCSHLVLKNTRGAEHTFAFGWTAPECGCVTIRARVKTSDTNAYILEDNDVSDGYLTKRVCRQNLKDILSHISPNEKEDILCKVSQNLQIGSLDQRPDIMSRRKLQYDNLSSLEKQTLDMALHQRLRSVNMCCGLRGEERHECLGDVRRRRLDHFCAYGEPLIPFTTDRVDYMMERKKECCWRLGERRYHCFGNIPQGDGVHSNAVWSVKNMRHKDDSDPLNDLEDFPVETLRQLPLLQAKVASKISRKSMPSIRNRALAGSVVQKKPKSIPGNTLTIPPKPVTRKNDVETTTAVVTMDTTKTTKHLLRKIKRYQTRLECCNQGKFYATKLMGDPWQMCSDEAYTYARTIRGGRRKCRAFYLRCCMEEYQGAQSTISGNQESDDDDDDDDKDDDDDDEEVADVTSTTSTQMPISTIEEPVLTTNKKDDDSDDDDIKKKIVKSSNRRSSRRKSGRKSRRKHRRSKNSHRG